MPTARTAWGWVIKGLGGALNILGQFLAENLEITERDCLLLEYQASRLCYLLTLARQAAGLSPRATIRDLDTLRSMATWERSEVVELTPTAANEDYTIRFDE